MKFMFSCPQGHVLEGEDTHAGLQSKCPQCGVAFYVPDYEPPKAQPPIMAAPARPVGPVSGDLWDDLGSGGQGALDLTAGGELSSSVLHIPCPNGHELETPIEMVGLEAYCPYCGDKFKLRNQDSVEHQRQQAIIDARRAQIWLRVAIVTAGLILIGLPMLMLISCLMR